MQREALADDLVKPAFEFFYSFSRFEFAMKENGYLVNKTPGAKAKPNWAKFVEVWENDYDISKAGRSLIEENPTTQIVVDHGELDFVEATFAEDVTNLQRVVDLIHIVRNNLFHGGKHGAKGWEDPKRMKVLLPIVTTILNELAEVSGMEADYTGFY